VFTIAFYGVYYSRVGVREKERERERERERGREGERERERGREREREHARWREIAVAGGEGKAESIISMLRGYLLLLPDCKSDWASAVFQVKRQIEI
jgi:hypothetical protein